MGENGLDVNSGLEVVWLGPFDDPAAGQDVKAPDHGGRLLVGPHPDPAAGTPHDVDVPAQRVLHPVHEAPLVGAVHPELVQVREALGQLRDRLQELLAADPVGDIGGVDQDLEDEAGGVDQEMALAPLHLLAAVIARRVGRPPLSVVLTDWLSMIPALGGGGPAGNAA